MAGPIASVIAREPLSAAQLGSVADFIASKAARVEGDSFWVSGRPFIWIAGEEYPGQLSEVDLSEVIGWQPKGQVILIAMCNDKVDHRILADLCIEVALLLDGIIDFEGWLGDVTPKIGQIWKSTYESVPGTAFSHLGTPEFLRWWLEQPGFHMIK